METAISDFRMRMRVPKVKDLGFVYIDMCYKSSVKILLICKFLNPSYELKYWPHFRQLEVGDNFIVCKQQNRGATKLFFTSSEETSGFCCSQTIHLRPLL